MIVLFGFFALLGLFAPGDVAWLTIAIAVLAAAVLAHSLRVRHHLGARDDEQMLRSALRERRGF